MKKIRRFFIIIFTVVVMAAVLTGCGQMNTVEGLIVTDEPFTEREDIEKAKQPEEVSAGKDIYGSVYFIESPKGMEYTGKWYVNGEEVKSDAKETTTDMCGSVVYKLEKDRVKEGTLKFEVIYKDQVISSRELTVK